MNATQTAYLGALYAKTDAERSDVVVTHLKVLAHAFERGKLNNIDHQLAAGACRYAAERIGDAPGAALAGHPPTKPGYYWAQWRKAVPGTRDAAELTPSDRWEPVQVFENALDDQHPEYLMVEVGGVERAQGLDCFVWGPAIKPAAGQPGIKVLEWGKTSYGTPEVSTIAGVYRLNHAGNGGWSVNRQRDVLRDNDGRTNFATVEAAKAAAQADFEARIRSALASPDSAPLTATAGEMWGELCKRTFAVQHNPNCPSPFLVRLPGKSGLIDMNPYGDVLGRSRNTTGDVLGFGKSLQEAALAALHSPEGGANG